MRMLKKIEIIFVILFSIYMGVNFGITQYNYATTPPVKYNYIGDEVWYVSAARNILREVLHTYPSCSSTCNATIQFKDAPSMVIFLTKYASNFSLNVLYHYNKVKFAAYFKGPKEDIFKLMKEKEKYNITLVQPGWRYPEQQGILKYLNLEHPPLGKYFIGITMLYKDVPYEWRIPGIVLGSLVIALVPIAIYLYSRSLALWIASLLLLFYDEPLRTMSMVAMLDVYAGALSALSLAALPFSPWGATAVLALAISSKYTAAFYLIPLAFLFWRRKSYGPLKALIIPSIVALLVFLALSMPLIVTLGPMKWLTKVLGGLEWFTVSRPSGPPPASPWDWIRGRVPSPLYIDPAVYVITSSSIMQTAMIAFFLLFPLRKRRKYWIAWMASFFLVSSLAGFEVLYIKGNRTLYTFYTVVFTPMADIATAGIIALLTNFDDLGESLSWWRRTLSEVSKWLWGEKKLRCELVETK
jgi:predicted membrane-bound dolichyl-phosphate-mannose-protein mannosyltransferase